VSRKEYVNQIRTCLTCGREAPRDALLRLAVAPEGTVLPDVAGKAPGRGLYTCPVPACIAGLAKSGGLKKALGGRKAAVDGAVLVGTARAQIEERLRSLLSLARKSGNLSIGTDESLEAQRAGGVKFVAVARDAAGRSAELSGAACLRLSGLDKSALGGLIGSGECAALGVRDEGLARSVRREVERLNGFVAGNQGPGVDAGPRRRPVRPRSGRRRGAAGVGG
jgi:predicted RNA-binding protein YlxR (DUF448 family)